MTIQGPYCYLDMGNNTVTYYKCNHEPDVYIHVLVLITQCVEEEISLACIGVGIGETCTQ